MIADVEVEQQLKSVKFDSSAQLFLSDSRSELSEYQIIGLVNRLQHEEQVGLDQLLEVLSNLSAEELVSDEVKYIANEISFIRDSVTCKKIEFPLQPGPSDRSAFFSRYLSNIARLLSENNYAPLWSVDSEVSSALRLPEQAIGYSNRRLRILGIISCEYDPISEKTSTYLQGLTGQLEVVMNSSIASSLDSDTTIVNGTAVVAHGILDDSGAYHVYKFETPAVSPAKSAQFNLSYDRYMQSTEKARSFAQALGQTRVAVIPHCTLDCAANIKRITVSLHALESCIDPSNVIELARYSDNRPPMPVAVCLMGPFLSNYNGDYVKYLKAMDKLIGLLHRECPRLLRYAKWYLIPDKSDPSMPSIPQPPISKSAVRVASNKMGNIQLTSNPALIELGDSTIAICPGNVAEHLYQSDNLICRSEEYSGDKLLHIANHTCFHNVVVPILPTEASSTIIYAAAESLICSKNISHFVYSLPDTPNRIERRRQSCFINVKDSLLIDVTTNSVDFLRDGDISVC